MYERLVLPFASWGPKPPNHRITCVNIMHNEKNLITGSQDGQICIWDIEHDPVLSIVPRCMILGHSSPVLCIADGDFVTNNTVVTSADDGELCSWNVDDGQCLETKKTQYIHTFMQSFKVSTKDCRLFCVGYYADILVLDPNTFSIRFRLSSKDQPDWITSIHILQPPQLSNIVIIGLSINGIVRIWTITDETSKSLDPIYDNDRKALDCLKSVQIISNPESMRLILIVCPTRWEIYDATDFKQICMVEAPSKTLWTGGNFLTRDQVIVWSNKGEGYLYQVTTKRGLDNKQPSTTNLKAHLSRRGDKRFLYSPRMCLSSTTNSGKLLVRGDHTGALTIWSLTSPNNESPKYHRSLMDAWSRAHTEDLSCNPLSEPKITCDIHLPALGKLAVAQDDGVIVVTSLTRSELFRLSSHNVTDANLIRLIGHKGKVNCLLYPNGTCPNYDTKHMVSGGIDCAVCLWDVVEGSLLHKFSIQASEITRLIIPPLGCSVRLQLSICSIASDHSVTILNLTKRTCALLASRQLFPVSVIKWKPTDDTMIVGCTDGSAYVWHIQSGQLVKVLQGSAAEEILAACDESKFWDSFPDVAKVLLGLLDLSSVANVQSKQAAKDALSAIALTRPTVFIITLAKEISKYNSKQLNANSQGPPILIKTKAEILRNIAIMIETMPLDVSNLIVETMDITLHCIDHSLLENRGLGEAFPAITRFYMVSYCSSSRRIAVGTVAGYLAMYELRAQSKPQIVPAHKSAVSACSFSPDGKYLASYSAGDNKLCFWLTATGLFGLGNARTRCVGAIDTPPVSADLVKKPDDLLRVARLIWVAGKVVILMFIDEREFRYQVAS